MTLPKRIQVKDRPRGGAWHQLPPNTVVVAAIRVPTGRSMAMAAPGKARQKARHHFNQQRRFVAAVASGEFPMDLAPEFACPYRSKFPVGGQSVVSREEAYALYLDEIAKSEPLRRNIIRRLKGKNLACYCAPPGPGEPDLCHAAALLAVANGLIQWDV